MKKIMMTLALLLSMAWATPASAFGFDWGVTGGLNLTKLKVKGEKKNIFSSDNQAGWFIGPKAHLNLAMGFGLDGALLYSQQKYQLCALENTTYKTSRSISVPVNLRYSIGLGSVASVFLTTGPQFDFNIGNKDYTFGDGMFERENMATTWNVGGGIKVLGHLEIGVGYNFALGNTGKTLLEYSGNSSMIGGSTNINNDIRANTFTTQATIYF